MSKPTIVLDTMVVKELAFPGGKSSKKMEPYADTLIAMRAAGYHIAIADIAVAELGKILEIEASHTKPAYFNLDVMLDILERFISPLTPFWPGRTEIQNRGDIKPRRNKEWQDIMHLQWTAFFNGLRARNFHAQKMFLNDEEVEIGTMMHRVDEMLEAERKIWLSQIELAKRNAGMPYDEQIEEMLELARLAHPHIKNARRRLDLRARRIVYMTNEILGEVRVVGKNDAMDNHLDFAHFYPVVVITNDGPYKSSCVKSGSEQAANILTTDQMVAEWKRDKEIRLKYSSVY